MTDTEQQMQQQARTYRELHRRDLAIEDLRWQLAKWQYIAIGLGAWIVLLLTILMWR